MRRLILPHWVAPFPTYRSARRTFHRVVGRVGVSWMLLTSPSLMASIGAKVIVSAKGSYSDVRFFVGRLSDSLR